MSGSDYSILSPFTNRQGSSKKATTAPGFSSSDHPLHHFESPFSGGGGMLSTSPSLHQGHLNSSGSSSYLPNYLLGGTVSPTNATQFGRSPMGHQGQSPHVEGQHMFSNSPMLLSEQRSSKKKFSPLIQNNIRDKANNGPPVEGLFDHERNSIDDLYPTNSWNSATPSRSVSMNTTQRPLNASGSVIYETDSVNSSAFQPRYERHDLVSQSPAQMDPFYTQGENLSTADVLDETWVTIFGFPPSLVGFVLEEFSHYGSIVRKETMSNVNWLHIQYQTKIQAKKALSKNGKILNNNMMIGVCKCIDKEIMMGKMPNIGLSKSVIGSPSVKDTPSTTPRQSTIRPLTAAYHAAANQNKIVQEGKGTPQRNNSIISRAMEYVFGL